MYLDAYPHTVYCSVALLDNQIVNYKIGGHFWSKEIISWRGQVTYDQMKEVVVEYVSIEVNNDEEHSKAFEVDSVEWMKQWKIHEQYRGGRPYEKEEQ